MSSVHSIVTTVSSAAALRYADATDDANPHYQSSTASVVPPLCVVMATLPLGVAPVVRAPGLLPPGGIARLLHYEEDIHWLAPLHVDAPWTVVANLAAVENHKMGEILRVITQVQDATRAVLAEVRTALFLRGGGTGKGTRRPSTPARAAVAEPVWERSWQVAANQSERYAAASGDTNPIHLDDPVAQQSGLRSRILHGLCTLAFAQRAVVHEAGGGDPRRLRRLRARFSRPVYMGDALVCRGSRGAQVDFTVHNAAGQAVLTQGWAELD